MQMYILSRVISIQACSLQCNQLPMRQSNLYQHHLCSLFCSRMTEVTNLYIDKGCSKERLTIVITFINTSVILFGPEKKIEISLGIKLIHVD